jgi:hypothetical protein
MAEYYVNKIAANDGDHEVHKTDCTHMPAELNRKYLGNFTNCAEAVREAKKYFSRSNGCIFCSKECHT